MKEIGSLFPIYEETEQQAGQSRNGGCTNEIRFSLCREALLYIAEKVDCGRKCVMIPAYTCQSVIAPFAQLGWQCCFYGIRKNLRINVESFLRVLEKNKPSMVIVHPYFGLVLSPEEKELLLSARQAGAVIVEDVTQCIFKDRNENCVDYYVGSYRKWLPLPDGAFLYQNPSSTQTIAATEKLSENTVFVEQQLQAMRLRGQYFITDQPDLKLRSIQLNKAAERLIDSEAIMPHKISVYSGSGLSLADLAAVKELRKRNFASLHHKLDPAVCNFPIGEPEVIETAPLYFPVYFSDRAAMQHALAKKGVYAPILWPVETPAVLIDAAVRFIYEHILLIPIDQRYNPDDMERIAEIINSNPQNND